MTEKEFLENYDMSKYERPSVAVDMVVFTIKDFQQENYRKLPTKKLSVLMIKRGNHPFKDKWALAGGFVMKDESTELSAKRELFEETGVDNVYLEQLYTFSKPDRDPRGWVISCSYMALVDYQKLNAHAGDDANDVEWFNVDFDIIDESIKYENDVRTIEKHYNLTLTNDEENITLKSHICHRDHVSINGTWSETIESDSNIAFDHATIISYAIERLRNKLEYTTIAFNLLPENFTFSELQMVYETILNKKLLSANFRRKMKKYVAISNETRVQSAGHRPAKLIKRNFI